MKSSVDLTSMWRLAVRQHDGIMLLGLARGAEPVGGRAGPGAVFELSMRWVHENHYFPAILDPLMERSVHGVDVFDDFVDFFGALNVFFAF